MVKMSYNVFFSHSSADRHWVERIVKSAQSTGISIYLHEYDPQPGRSIADKIKQRIRSCDAFVVLITPSSQYSAYVHQEIGFAEDIPKPIIPLVQPGTDERSLGMLQGREYIAFDLYNPDKAISTLLGHLQKLKGAKESGAAILVLATAALLLLAWKSGKEK